MNRWLAPLMLAPLCVGLAAPPAPAQALELTLLGGLSSATHAGEGTRRFKPSGRRNGLAAGAGLAYRLTPALGVEMQALYTQKGAKYFDNEWQEKFDYLEVPLLATYRISAGRGGVSPLVMAGPALGVKMSAKIIDEGEEWEEDDVRRTDFGVVLGAGTALQTAGGEFLLLGRYVLGLNDLYKEGYSAGAFKNRSLQVLAGYSIPLNLGRR